MNLEIFAARIKEYATDGEKINATLLANKLGFSRVTITNILNGKHNPSTKLLIALAQRFNCSTDYLLNLKDIPPETNFKPIKPFGKILRRCLDESNIKEVQLQFDLKVSSSLTYRWLTDKLLPNVEHLIKLSEYFNYSVDYLLGRE